MTIDSNFEEGTRAMMKGITANLPLDLEARAEALTTVRRVIHEETASAIGPVLRDALKDRPVSSLLDRKRLAAWIDGIVSPLGIAPRCPTTGQPAFLIAEFGTPRTDDEGRFTYVVHDPRDGLYRSHPTRNLTEFDLVPAPSDYERRFHKYRVDESRDHTRQSPNRPRGR